MAGAVPRFILIYFVLLLEAPILTHSMDDLFYPFGAAVGDVANPKVDDGGSPEISISISFPFFETSYRSLYVNNNGVVSFQAAVSQFTPNPFPLANGRAFITPFWGDVDNRNGGEIYYRQSTEPILLQRATADINRYSPSLPFQAQWVFVATWDRVAFYGSRTSKVNSFQAVLITNERQSFIILNYGNIEWTTGTASGGNADTGLGGTEAQAGFNSGGSTHYFSIPGSQTPDIVNIESTSNVQEPGRWVFRTDTFSVLEGCIFNGRYIRQDDSFWTNSSCETKCKCNSNSSLVCEHKPCAPYEVCLSSPSFYICKPASVQTCTIFGDPHYQTFDGQLFHFQGTCTYVLSEVCQRNRSLPAFRVEAKNENRGNTAVSWLRLIRLFIYNTEITLIKGTTHHILLNGTRVSVPLVIGGGQIRVSMSGFMVTVSTEFGLKVQFDGSSHATISLPASFHSATCGLCGNMNAEPADEFQLPNGTVVSSEVEFGRGWRVDDGDEMCEDQCSQQCELCTPEQSRLYSGQSYCGLIDRVDSAFNICHTALPARDFIQSCVLDLCVSGGAMPILCQAISTYAARCRLQGVSAFEWRGPGLCEMQCPPHSHYQTCTSACPATCTDPNALLFCNEPCVEGCKCDPGYFLSGGVCVTSAECGCSFQGRYYSKGESVILTESCSQKCSCLNASVGISCSAFSCGHHEDCRLVNGVRGCYPRARGTCFASGDPHYTSFDSKRFDFQGSCKYTFSKSCGEAGNLTAFSVDVENDHRGSQAVTWTRLVEVQVYGHRIQVSRSQTGSVQVNGESVNLPVRLESGKVDLFQSGSAAVLETEFGLRVSYDWSHYVVVMVPSLYSGSLCGLCGNFNGEPADDFVSPNGTALSTAAVFGNSWKISDPEAVCSDDPGSVIVCSDSDRRLLSSESYCGVLSNVSGPFHQCHSVLSPMTAQENCIFDLCAVGVSGELLCQAIGSYAAECQRRGVMTGDWRNVTGCGIQCPENSHFEVCGNPCEGNCANISVGSSCAQECAEGCFCDRGYLRSGDSCVPSEQCGCTHDGVYMKIEEVRLTADCSSRCQCLARNEVRCVPAGCRPTERCTVRRGIRGCLTSLSTCTVSGDPHYLSFDDAVTHFQGTCDYDVAKVCSRSSANWFRVTAENQHRRNNLVSFVSRVHVYLLGVHIAIESGRGVLVDDAVVSLPHGIQGLASVSQSDGFIVVDTVTNVEVHYDGRSTVLVKVGPEYANRLCGMCGNFNGNVTDDKVLPNGQTARSDAEFGNSWKTENSDLGCQDDNRNVELDCPRRFQFESLCSIIVNETGPFSECHWHLDPTNYYTSCVYDLCAYGTSNLLLCDAISGYERACTIRGLSIPSWRASWACPLQNPCERESCTAEEWCGEQRGVVGCFCDDDATGDQTNKNYDYRLVCNGNSSEISLSRCLLFSDAWHTRYFHLKDPSCIGQVTDGRLTFHFDSTRPSCGSTLKVNTTHFTHSNTIRASVVENYGLVSRNRTISLDFSCVYALTINISLFVSDEVVQSVVNIALPSGEGSYEVRMIMYQDPEYRQPYTHTPVRLSVDDRVYIGITVMGMDPNQFVVTLDSCWTTPDNDPSSQTRWGLVSNQCPSTLSEVEVKESGTSSICRFSFSAFKFIGDVNQIYLHCQIRLCDFRTSQCLPSCSGQRNAQSSNSKGQSSVLSIGPITKADVDTPPNLVGDNSNGNQIFLGSSVALVCLVLISCLLY